jgi:hypothetical protein
MHVPDGLVGPGFTGSVGNGVVVVVDSVGKVGYVGSVGFVGIGGSVVGVIPPLPPPDGGLQGKFQYHWVHGTQASADSKNPVSVGQITRVAGTFKVSQRQ